MAWCRFWREKRVPLPPIHLPSFSRFSTTFMSETSVMSYLTGQYQLRAKMLSHNTTHETRRVNRLPLILRG